MVRLDDETNWAWHQDPNSISWWLSTYSLTRLHLLWPRGVPLRSLICQSCDQSFLLSDMISGIFWEKFKEIFKENFFKEKLIIGVDVYNSVLPTSLPSAVIALDIKSMTLTSGMIWLEPYCGHKLLSESTGRRNAIRTVQMTVWVWASFYTAFPPDPRLKVINT